MDGCLNTPTIWTFVYVDLQTIWTLFMWSNRCNGFNQERRPAVSINQSGSSSNKQAGQRGDHSPLLQELVLNKELQHMVVPYMFAARRLENQKSMENKDACSSVFQGGEQRHHEIHPQPPPNASSSNADAGWMKPWAATPRSAAER